MKNPDYNKIIDFILEFMISSSQRTFTTVQMAQFIGEHFSYLKPGQKRNVMDRLKRHERINVKKVCGRKCYISYKGIFA